MPGILSISYPLFGLQAEMIYEHHADSFTADEGNLREVSAIVIGREMKKIALIY
jgi:hypothetical protein